MTVKVNSAVLNLSKFHRLYKKIRHLFPNTQNRKQRACRMCCQ